MCFNDIIIVFPLKMDDVMKCKPGFELLASKERIFTVILHKWSTLEETLKILKLFYETTKQLQKTDATLSDMFGLFLALRQNLQDYVQSCLSSINLAECLITELLYLDRRFSSLLSDDEIGLAKLNLIKIWGQLRSLQIETSQEAIQKPLEFNDRLSAINKYFASRGNQTGASLNGKCEPDFSKSDEEILSICEKIYKIGRLDPSVSVLDFWEEKRFVYPEIHLLSTVFNGIPPTESKNERDFSTLSFIFNDKRYRLDPDLLENILLIKLNKDLVYKILETDLEELEKSNFFRKKTFFPL